MPEDRNPDGSFRHNSRIMVYLVKPQPYVFDREEEEWAPQPQDEADEKRMWDLWKRIRKVFTDLGAESCGSEMVCETEGFNFEVKFAATPFRFDSEVVAKLEGLTERRATLVRQAMEKLTDEEKDAIGCFDLKTKVVYLG